jgi:hypothetical protein
MPRLKTPVIYCRGLPQSFRRILEYHFIINHDGFIPDTKFSPFSKADAYEYIKKQLLTFLYKMQN